jgi:hypothetical protein
VASVRANQIAQQVRATVAAESPLRSAVRANALAVELPRVVRPSNRFIAQPL